MARTNLKLGALGRAVGVNGDSTSTTRLGADGRGSTGTQTSMRADFAVDTVVGPVISDTTPNEPIVVEQAIYFYLVLVVRHQTLYGLNLLILVCMYCKHLQITQLDVI